MKENINTMDFTKDIMYAIALAFAADGADVQHFQHAYRINGVMDLMKSKFTVYDINNHKYHHFEDEVEMLSVIEEIIMRNPERIFKKTKTGGMSYKEFKENLRKAQ
jgi:hypothetical protein